jgi:hypothetical protein
MAKGIERSDRCHSGGQSRAGFCEGSLKEYFLRSARPTVLGEAHMGHSRIFTFVHSSIAATVALPKGFFTRFVACFTSRAI